MTTASSSHDPEAAGSSSTEGPYVGMTHVNEHLWPDPGELLSLSELIPVLVFLTTKAMGNIHNIYYTYVHAICARHW